MARCMANLDENTVQTGLLCCSVIASQLMVEKDIQPTTFQYQGDLRLLKMSLKPSRPYGKLM